MFEKTEEMKKQKICVPIWEKKLLTLNEAAELFNICAAKLRELTNAADCEYVLFNGNKRLIKRDAFNDYLAGAYSI